MRLLHFHTATDDRVLVQGECARAIAEDRAGLTPIDSDVDFDAETVAFTVTTSACDSSSRAPCVSCEDGSTAAASGASTTFVLELSSALAG